MPTIRRGLNEESGVAGSFDPITNGHLWMIEQGVHLSDELVVAVGVNPDKMILDRKDICLSGPLGNWHTDLRKRI
ncbi:MAG: hypothetical protein A2162_10080 [Deltaproteobacteria bacterium RBG_13_52_11b]|nr:MAG: hypothetical protein A2162_10080 [Deltaproteobacteria bacterium RBG_13_52_11b]